MQRWKLLGDQETFSKHNEKYQLFHICFLLERNSIQRENYGNDTQTIMNIKLIATIFMS